MSKRDYDGDPIDMSWNDPPWAGDGETLDVIDADGDGEVSVDLDGEALFPEPWGPTEEQVARARWLLLNTDITQRELSRRLNTTQRTIGRYIRGQRDIDPNTPPAIQSNDKTGNYEVLKSDGDIPEKTDRVNSNKGGVRSVDQAKLTAADVTKLRRQLRGGATCSGLADRYPVCPSILAKYARGDGPINPDTVPIEFDQSEQRWVPIDDAPETEQAELSDDTDEQEQEPDEENTTEHPDRVPVKTTRRDPEPNRGKALAVAFILGAIVSRIVGYLSGD